MLEEGYKKIVCIDQSNVCVKTMSEKYKDKEGIKYSQMDAKAMNFHEAEFDAILDKATLDSILVNIKINLVWIKFNSQRKQSDIRSL